MTFDNLSSVNLKALVKLVEQKESLLAQVAKIDADLARFIGPKLKAVVKPGAPALPAARAVSVAPAPKAPKRAKRKPRGQLKNAVVALLKGAGKEGLAVKDIAAKVGSDSKGIFAWFYATGKTIKQIKKVGEARYAWVG